MSALPKPIEPTGPAPEKWTVVRVVQSRLAIARQIQANVKRLAASDSSLDEDVRLWAGRVAVFEARVKRATSEARDEAAGGGT